MNMGIAVKSSVVERPLAKPTAHEPDLPLIEPHVLETKSETERLWPRYLLPLSLGFLVVSMTGSVLIDAELKGLYHFIFTYLVLPALVLSYGVAWFALPGWRHRSSRLKVVCAPGLVALAMILTCGGAVNYSNAAFGNGAAVQFSGPVTKLGYSSGRSGRGYYLVIQDSATGRPREFRITRQEYTHLKIGYAYVRTMKQGGLGYAYSWRR
jgi:hypothetical protein